MARYNEDAVWQPVFTGELDEDQEQYVDYVSVGSEPLNPYEVMIFNLIGASHRDDSLIAYPEF